MGKPAVADAGSDERTSSRPVRLAAGLIARTQLLSAALALVASYLRRLVPDSFHSLVGRLRGVLGVEVRGRVFVDLLLFFARGGLDHYGFNGVGRFHCCFLAVLWRSAGAGAFGSTAERYGSAFALRLRCV